MQSGNFVELLRELSTANSAGNIKVAGEEVVVNVSVKNGHIVGVREEGVDGSQRIVELLVDAGFVVEQVLELVTQARIGVNQLRRALVERNYVQEKELAQASRAYELNLLHSLRKSGRQLCDYVESEGRLFQGEVNIPINDFLAELPELDIKEQAFVEIFGPIDGESTVIYQTDGVGPDGDELDNKIWSLVGAEGSCPADIVSMSLESRWRIAEGLINLYRQGKIQVRLEPNLNSSGLVQKIFESKDSQRDSVRRDVEESSDSEKGKTNKSDFPPEFEPDSNKWELSERTTGSQKGLFFRSLNYRLLEPKNLQRTVLVVIIAYLFVVAVFVPGMFEQWFNSLSEFSSRS